MLGFRTIFWGPARDVGAADAGLLPGPSESAREADSAAVDGCDNGLAVRWDGSLIATGAGRLLFEPAPPATPLKPGGFPFKVRYPGAEPDADDGISSSSSFAVAVFAFRLAGLARGGGTRFLPAGVEATLEGLLTARLGATRFRSSSCALSPSSSVRRFSASWRAGSAVVPDRRYLAGGRAGFGVGLVVRAVFGRSITPSGFGIRSLSGLGGKDGYSIVPGGAAPVVFVDTGLDAGFGAIGNALPEPSWMPAPGRPGLPFMLSIFACALNPTLLAKIPLADLKTEYSFAFALAVASFSFLDGDVGVAGSGMFECVIVVVVVVPVEGPKCWLTPGRLRNDLVGEAMMWSGRGDSPSRPSWAWLFL